MPHLAGESKYGDWSVEQWQAAAANNPSLFKKALMSVLDGAPKVMPAAISIIQEIAQLEATPCSLCTSVFETAQAMTAHAFQVHGVRTAARYHVETTFCTRCLLQLWTRQRLLDHLRRSAPCAAHALQLPRLEDAVVRCLDDEARELTRANVRAGRHRNWADMPSTVLSGPRPFIMY